MELCDHWYLSEALLSFFLWSHAKIFPWVFGEVCVCEFQSVGNIFGSVSFWLDSDIWYFGNLHCFSGCWYLWKLLKMEKCIWSLGKAQHCTTVPPTAAGVLLQDAVLKVVWKTGPAAGCWVCSGRSHRSEPLSSLQCFWVGVIFTTFLYYYFVLSLCVSWSSCGSPVMSHCIIWKSHCSVTPVGPPLAQFSCVTDAVWDENNLNYWTFWNKTFPLQLLCHTDIWPICQQIFY